MAIDAAEGLMSAVEFLQWEREQPDKFELIDNRIIAMPGSSPSTEMRDRGAKLDQYLRIPSLIGYFLVAQDQPRIEAYTRSGSDRTFSRYAGLASSLAVPALDSRLPLGFVYRKARFKQDKIA